MDNNTVSTQLKDLLDKNNSIGIAVGKNLGVDEMAGALSLYLALKSNGKNVNIVCPTDVLVEHSRLVGIDKVKRDFDLNGEDMTVSFPYQEGEIEKISYTLENGFLNIIVKAGEDGLSFDEKSVEFKRSEGYPSLLIVVGTSRLSDLDRIYDAQALKDTTVVNIDNKPDNQGYGDISIVAPNSSSISEKITEIMLSMGLNIDIDIAQNLLLGIESATDNFQSSKTTPLAFEMTGELIRKGAVRSKLNTMQIDSQNDEMDYSQDEDEFSSFFPPTNFPQRQPVSPSQGGPLRTTARQMPSQRLNQQQNAGQDLQSLRNMQRVQPGNQDLTAERKDTKTTERTAKNPPVDWLTPKIYKGSTNI